MRKKEDVTDLETPLNNDDIKVLYDNFLTSGNVDLTKMLLHTSYIDRSALAKPRKVQESTIYKCEICGQVFEINQEEIPKCPNCGQTEKYLIRLE